MYIEGGEAVAKVHPQAEETIFDLKQQLMWRFEDLKQKHEGLKSQLSLMPIKGEGKFYVIKKLLYVCTTTDFMSTCSGRKASYSSWTSTITTTSQERR